MSEVRDLLDVAELTRFEGDKLTPEDCEWDNIEDVQIVLDIWRQSKIQEQAAKQLTRVAGERLAELLGTGGAVAYGDNLVRYRMRRNERCADVNGFVDYLTLLVKSDDVDLADVLNPNSAKKGWMSKAVRDTFFDWHDDKPGLSMIPKSQAPKRLQHLTDGEVVLGD